MIFFFNSFYMLRINRANILNNLKEYFFFEDFSQGKLTYWFIFSEGKG